MLAGALAGSATVFITNPIWVVNTRMTARQSNAEQELPDAPPKKAPSTVGTLLSLLRKDGPQALFAGVLPALVLVINPILQYTFFEQLRSLVAHRRKVTPTDAFYLGALGKLLATTITYPYITVKSKAHVAQKDTIQESMIQSLRKMIREEGWGGLYKGGCDGPYDPCARMLTDLVRACTKAWAVRFDCCIPLCLQGHSV